MPRAVPDRFARVRRGAPWQDLDTPCLVADLSVLEANIRKMASFLDEHGVACRPHFKAHMCMGIARKQFQAGAIGLCVAKLSAAEVIIDEGVEDVLLANQVVGATKIRRLVELAERSSLKVLVDDPHNVDELSEAFAAAKPLEVLVEVRVRSADSTFARGFTRNGVNSPAEVLVLAQRVERSPGLVFRGLMAYEGPHPRIKDPEERRAAIVRDMRNLLESVELLRDAGMPCDIVSAGGTDTYRVTATLDCVTELQPGSYALMNTTKARRCKDFEQAVYLVSTVMGRPEPGTAILDVGMKSLKMSKQDTTAEDLDRPPVVSVAGAELHHLSEEHAAISVSGEAARLRPGDKILVAPSYGAPTINYHDCIYGVRDGRVEEVWAVSARGCSQ